MSTMPISLNALAAVRETIYLSYFWSVQEDEKPLGLFDAFLGTQSHRYVNENEALAAAETFVNRAYIFNCIAYFKGAHDKSNKEPAEWGCTIEALKNTHKKRLSIVQLYKTVQCIDYNTDAEGWFTPEKYKQWDRRLDYEAFKKMLARLQTFLSAFIIARLDEYKAAKWDY